MFNEGFGKSDSAQSEIKAPRKRTVCAQLLRLQKLFTAQLSKMHTVKKTFANNLQRHLLTITATKCTYTYNHRQNMQ